MKKSNLVAIILLSLFVLVGCAAIITGLLSRNNNKMKDDNTSQETLQPLQTEKPDSTPSLAYETQVTEEPFYTPYTPDINDSKVLSREDVIANGYDVTELETNASSLLNTLGYEFVLFQLQEYETYSNGKSTFFYALDNNGDAILVVIYFDLENIKDVVVCNVEKDDTQWFTVRSSGVLERNYEMENDFNNQQ